MFTLLYYCIALYNHFTFFFLQQSTLFQIKTIRDNVEYYVMSSRDPDFDYDDECIYEDLDLDELGQSIGGSLLATSPQDEDHFANMSSTPTSTNSSSPSPSPNVANHSKEEIVSIRLVFVSLAPSSQEFVGAACISIYKWGLKVTWQAHGRMGECLMLSA